MTDSIIPSFGADIKKEFMLREDCVYLNHGSYGGNPRCVYEKRLRYLEELESHPDSWFRYKSFEYMRRAKAKVAEFMGIQTDDTFFIQNVTKATNTVMKTFPLKSGDAYLMNTLTYGPLKLTARSAVNRVEGAKLYQIDIDFPSIDEDSIIERYEEFLEKNPDVKLAALDHITSPTSVIMPVKRLTEVCHKHGVVVVIDAAHIPGQLKIDIQDIDAVFYTGTMHKWAFSPRACAFVWMNPKRQHAWFRPLITSKLENESLHDAFSFEGTKDDTPFICSVYGIEYMTRIGGMDKIVQYNSMLVSQGATYLVEKWGTKHLPIPKHMEAPCLRIVYLPFIPGFSDRLEDANSTVKTKIGGEFQKFLLDEFDVQIQVTVIEGHLVARVSAQVYNTMDDFIKLGKTVLSLSNRKKEV